MDVSTIRNDISFSQAALALHDTLSFFKIFDAKQTANFIESIDQHIFEQDTNEKANVWFYFVLVGPSFP